MEDALNTDLRAVRVHTDARASEAADELHAEAFASGRDVYFGAGRFQPSTTEGRRLLAHELAHTVQQSEGALAATARTPQAFTVSQPDDLLERQASAVADRVATGQPVPPGSISSAGESATTQIGRQPATAAPPAPTTQAAPESELSDEEAGNAPGAAPTAALEDTPLTGTFAPSEPVATFLASQSRRGGPVPVRFGNLASGTITVARVRETYRTPGGAPQSIPLTHPALAPIVQAGVRPVLAIRIRDSVVEGYVSIEAAGRRAPKPDALLDWMRENPAIMGWVGFDIRRFPRPVNELKDGILRLQVTNFAFKLAGFMDGTASFGLENEAVTFNATSTVHVQGLTDAQLEIARDAEGHLAGRVEVPVSIANFSGNVIAVYGNGVVDIEGTVGYTTEKLSGQVTLIVTDLASARNVALNRLGPEAVQAAGAEVAGTPETGPRPGPRAVAGWGVLNFAFTEWMTGQAQVIIDSEGNVTVIGEIAPPAEIELFPQRDIVRNLFTIEVRTLYGVPLVGNVFLFANIGMDALAKFGPGKIYNIRIEGTYSTDPAVFNRFSITGTLNISAFAGLRLRGEGGVGVELLGHDIKAGVGVFALAGIRGYVEATPTVGYREVADPEAGQKGEFYLRGHMEIAAQPFLALGGDLFVELDSPWWSPAPDDKWTWPLGQLEYPLPGQFGIGADIDYVLGSGQMPEVQLGEVDFSADRFMTDLLNDHVPPKSKGEQEQPGEWKEEEVTGAPLEPQLVDTQGAPPADQPAQGRQTPEQGEVPKPGVDQRWLRGMQALGGLATQGRSDPYSESELNVALTRLKAEHGFTQLRAQRRGDEWLVHARMNPDNEDKPAQIPAEPAAPAQTAEPASPMEVAAGGETFLVFNVGGESFRITLDEAEATVSPRMSALRQIEVLVEGLEIDEDTAKSLLRGIDTPGQLLLSFARAKGRTPPPEFLREEMLRGKTAMAAVDAPVPSGIRSRLVYLGDEREPLSDLALVYRERFPGQFERSRHPEANVMEYNYRVSGTRATAEILPLGIVQVGPDGTVIKILGYVRGIPGGAAGLKQVMVNAGWRLANPLPVEGGSAV